MGFRQALLVLWKAVPAMLMILIVIGGILAGFFTPTESAAIAVLYCLALGFAYRELTMARLPGILLTATRTTAIVMLLVGVSSAMSWVMFSSGVPDMISSGLMGLTDNPTVVLILMMMVLLVVGTFMDPTPAILIFTPIFLPIAEQFDIDPVHFGTMIVFNLSLGTITPPVGNVLFIASRVGEQRIEPVIRRLVPFFGALAVVLFVVVFVPELSLWLPEQLGLVTGD